jgi:hypothetical protein
MKHFTPWHCIQTIDVLLTLRQAAKAGFLLVSQEAFVIADIAPRAVRRAGNGSISMTD